MSSRSNYWVRKVNSSRLSRRRFVGGATVVGAGAAGLALVGCGNDDDETPSPTAPSSDDTDDGNGNGNGVDPTPTPDDSAPQTGGRLRTGTFLNVLGIDPHIEVSVGLTTCARVYSSLIAYDTVNGEYKELLANGLEQPSDTEFIFSLRENANFHNIAPVNDRPPTPDDVLYSLERFRDLPEAQNNDFYKAVVENMEVIDDHTFRITTQFPYAESLVDIAGSQKSVVPHEAVEQFGDLTNEAIGSGPYILEEYTRGETELLVRNPDYWEDDKPYLDEYHRITILDMNSLIQAYESDQLDINGALLNRLDYDDLSRLNDRVTGTIPALHYGSLGLNAGAEPFNDPRVRQAVYLSMDRREFIEKVGFGDGLPMGPLSAGLDFWALTEEELAPYITPNYDRARELLAEAGYPDGLDIDIETSQGVQLYIDHAEIAVPELAKSGIRANLQLSDLSTYLSTKLFAADFGAATIFTHNPYETPKIPLGFYHKRGIGAFSWWNYENDEISDAIDDQAQEMDLEARREKVRNVQLMILDDWGPLVNFYSPVGYWSYHQRVAGFDPSYRGFQSYRYTENLQS